MNTSPLPGQKELCFEIQPDSSRLFCEVCGRAYENSMHFAACPNWCSGLRRKLSREEQEAHVLYARRLKGKMVSLNINNWGRQMDYQCQYDKEKKEPVLDIFRRTDEYLATPLGSDQAMKALEALK